MSIELEHKQGLIAGDGCLPVKMAQYAKENGFEVICISLAKDNLSQLKKYCSRVYSCHPGEINKIEKIMTEEEIKQVTFLGKVHKRVLLKVHKFDERAIEILKSVKRLNDDEVMLLIVNEFEKHGISVLDQTIFIKNLMIPAGVLGKNKPTKELCILKLLSRPAEGPEGRAFVRQISRKAWLNDLAEQISRRA